MRPVALISPKGKEITMFTRFRKYVLEKVFCILYEQGYWSQQDWGNNTDIRFECVCHRLSLDVFPEALRNAVIKIAKPGLRNGHWRSEYDSSRIMFSHTPDGLYVED